ncbi:MAG: 1,2-phenylacetyl-CoA epoxidase subunit PaaD [Streptosporangiaceae bacterium]
MVTQRAGDGVTGGPEKVTRGAGDGVTGGPEIVTPGAGDGVADDLEAAREIAAAVPDPELPMMTLGDLGILRRVTAEDGRVVVTITPTYSGCPALLEIAQDLRYRLGRAGFADVIVRTELAPAWSSDQITPEGRAKLRAAGLAPPNPVRPDPGRPSRGRGPVPLPLTMALPKFVACPRCGSLDTERTAAFGPTACTALFRCGTCREPFEYVKDI